MTLNDFWLFCVRFGQLLLPNGSLCGGPNLPDCESCLQDFRFSQGTPEKAVIRLLQVTREVSGHAETDHVVPGPARHSFLMCLPWLPHRHTRCHHAAKW